MNEPPRSTVAVSVPARADFVHVLRSMTASVAARLDFPYDEIEDLRLAVDEACAQLLAVGSDGSKLTLHMTPNGDRLEIVAAIDASVASWPPPDAEESLAWRLLSALAEEARFEMGVNGPALRLTKRVPRSAESMDERRAPSR